MEILAALLVWIWLSALLMALQSWLGIAHPLLGLFFWSVVRFQRTRLPEQVWAGWRRLASTGSVAVGFLVPALACGALLYRAWGWHGLRALFTEHLARTAILAAGGLWALWIAAVVLGALPAVVAGRGSGGAPDLVAILRLLVREGALALWFTLAWWGVVRGQVLTWTFSPVAGAWGMALLALLVIRWEGEPEGRPEAGPRWLLLLLVLATLGSGLAGPWNFGISVLARAPLDLERVLGGLAAIGVIAALCAVHNLLWHTRSPWLNALALRLLRSLLERQLLVRAYLRLRHLGHWLGRTRVSRILRVLRDLIESFFGRLPAWLFPRPQQADRLELLLRARLLNADAEVETLFLRWSAERLRSGGDNPADDLVRALHHRAWLLLVLGDHLLCPFDPCPAGWRHDAVQELAERVERHLLRVRRVAAAGGPVAAEVDARLRARLHRYQEHLGPPQEGQALAVHRLLTGLIVEQDWTGVIDLERSLARTTPYVLTAEDHRDCGEAWARQACELGTGTLSSWAFERAASHYYRAQAREHLAALRDLVVQRQGKSRAA